MESPVEKTCIFVYQDFNIVFDMTDGIHESFSFNETVGLHYRYLQKFKDKKYFYVKVHYSQTKSINHVKLSLENNGTVLTCPGFSLYDNYTFLYSNRKEIRSKNIQKNKNIVFSGNLSNLEYPELYSGVEFKYPITCVDAKILLQKEIQKILLKYFLLDYKK